MSQVDETFYSRAVRNFIKKAEPKMRESIKEAINCLKSYPPDGDVKSLQGYKDGRLRYRQGKYRIIFRYEENDNKRVLYIIDIGSRGDIYK